MRLECIIVALFLLLYFDLLGCFMARSAGLPFRKLYYLPMGGWLALWRENYAAPLSGAKGCCLACGGTGKAQRRALAEAGKEQK